MSLIHNRPFWAIIADFAPVKSAKVNLEPFLKKGSGQRLMELMMRERNDPHLPRHLFLEEIVQPVKTLMKKALLQTCQKQNRSSKKFTAVAWNDTGTQKSDKLREIGILYIKGTSLDQNFA